MTRRSLLAAFAGAAGLAAAGTLSRVDRAFTFAGRDPSTASQPQPEAPEPVRGEHASHDDSSVTRLTSFEDGREYQLELGARGMRTRSSDDWSRSSVRIDGAVEAVGGGAEAASVGPLIVGRGDVMGVYGEADDGPGVKGSGSIGVEGVGAAGVAGHGERGGVFAGNVAQLRLEPSDLATHPPSGTAGDLFVDRAARLWFCAGGSDWRRVA